MDGYEAGTRILTLTGIVMGTFVMWVTVCLWAIHRKENKIEEE